MTDIFSSFILAAFILLIFTCGGWILENIWTIIGIAFVLLLIRNIRKI